MKIYIDESGLFSKHSEQNNIDKAWCTVGAITVPHHNEKKVNCALINLKKSLNLKPTDEIKKRPDPESACFIAFIEALKSANCTVHAMTTNRSFLCDEKTNEHKRNQIEARKRFLKLEGEKFSSEELVILQNELNIISNLIERSSFQEYNQIILQSALISFMLDKTITFYAKTAPRELSRFTWIYDRKNDTQKIGVHTFESLFLKLMPPFVEVSFIRDPRGLLNFEDGYKYFFRNFGLGSSNRGMPTEEVFKRNRIYEIDYSKHSNLMLSFDFNKLLSDASGFHDSAKNPGLQVADLVISSINRLLRGNVDNKTKVAELLGGLTVNSPRLDLPSVPMLRFYDSVEAAPEFSDENLDLLNSFSRILYTPEFKKGFTETFNNFKKNSSPRSWN